MKSQGGQVTRRADDPFGQGFGNVKTGFVSSQKLSFLQRGGSVDRSDRGSPAPSNGSGRGKGLRVTWAESPNGSRPGSNMGWTERVAEIESQTLRAQTPPLAGEWSMSKENKLESKLVSQTSVAYLSNQLSSGNQFMSQPILTNANVSSGSSITQANQTTMFQSTQKSFACNNATNANNFFSQPNKAVARKNSMTSGSQVDQTSSFQSAQKTSFSSSSTFKSSTSFQTGSARSQTFEAFPGMGNIENLNLENEKAGK